MKFALVEVRFLQYELYLNSLVSLFLILCSVPTLYGKFHMVGFPYVSRALREPKS